MGPRSSYRALWWLAIAVALAPPASGHGGAYNPPPQPPDRRPPGDTVGPARPPGSTGTLPLTAGSQPVTGTDGAPIRPTSPTSPPPSSSPLSGSTTTPTVLPDVLAWTWWWEFNKEPFLNLRAVEPAGPAETGSDAFFLGRGEAASAAARHRPTVAQIRERILPALVRTLSSTKAPDVTTACLIALARVGEDLPPADRAGLAEILRAYLADGNQEIAETAALALGVLGSEGGAPRLADLLLDLPEARRAVRAAKIGSRTRAFAAYALGLIGAQSSMEDVRRYVAHKLALALAADTGATPDVSVACVLALGRVPLPWAGDPLDSERGAGQALTSRESEIELLLAVLADSKRHRWVRAHASTALAWLAEPSLPDSSASARDAVAAALASVLAKSSEEMEVRQSCALALGLVGDADRDPVDQDVRAALLAATEHAQLRPFAAISLGRVLGRAGIAAEADTREMRGMLLKTLARRDGEPSQAAALALALYQHGRRTRGIELDPEIQEALVDKLASSRSPLDEGAYSIALGLSGELSASETLLAKLRAASDDATRGFAAIGLALVGARDVTGELRSIVADSTYRPVLLKESALALSMLGDREGIEILCSRLETTHSLFALASLAQALGRIGDVSAVDPLIALVEDATRPDSTRAFAAVALGLVSDQDPFPWNTPFALEVNYAALPPTLYDAQGFGLLNLL
jgi:HEAT repeat protein